MPNLKPYISPSTEAFVLIAFENNAVRWPYQVNVLDKIPKKEQTLEQKNHPSHQPKYSDPKAGQCRWGGWSLEGRQRLAEVTAQIAKHQKDNAPHLREQEDKFLKWYQAKHKIQSLDAKCRAKGKKGKKCAAVFESIPCLDYDDSKSDATTMDG
jgi:hypothetical protein